MSAASGPGVGLTYRYAFPTVQLFREIREELIWADGGQVKKATDAAVLSVLGPKTEADLQAGKKKPAKKVSSKHREMFAADRYALPPLHKSLLQVYSLFQNT